MIYAVLKFDHPFNPQLIRDTCLDFNIVAQILDERTNQWCLETENAGNFFWFGYHYKDRIADWYAGNTPARIEFRTRKAKRT